MSKARKIFSFLVLMLAVVAMTTFVAAQEKSDSDPQKREMKRGEIQSKRNIFEGKRGKRGKRGHRGHRGFMRMLRGIELTDNQKEQIKTLAETQRATNQPMREEARELYMRKRDGTITEAENQRLKQIHTDMKASGEQLKATILGLLTAEQRAEIDRIKAEREERRQERRRRWQERKQQREQAAPPVDGAPIG